MNGACIDCLSEWVMLVCYPKGNFGKGNGICENCANKYKLIFERTKMATIYLHSAFKKDEITAFAEYINESNIDFDTIAFSGMSGSLMAAPVAFILNKNLFLVRKSGDLCHGWDNEYITYPKNYIIIDDLISTGKTIQNIIGRVKRGVEHAELKAIFLYNNRGREKETNFLKEFVQVPIFTF